MKILMVGHSRSGKTSYMTGLYHEYGDKSNGFGLWMSDNNKKSNLKRLGNNITKGIYPSGTDIATEYNFWLQYNNKLLIPFDWYDYRGGALSESSKSSKDAEFLLSQMNSADALIVFLDGEKITSMTNDDLEEEYDVLLWAIQNSISKRFSDSNFFPVSIVITKGDLYSDYSTLYEAPGLHYFLPLINNIAQSKTSAGMIGIVEVSPNGIFNIFSPLIFSLYYAMHHYVKQRVASINAEVEKINKLDLGTINEICFRLDRWLGYKYKSDREKATECIKRIEEEKTRLSELQSLSEVMEEILAHLVEKNMIIRF